MDSLLDTLKRLDLARLETTGEVITLNYDDEDENGTPCCYVMNTEKDATWAQFCESLTKQQICNLLNIIIDTYESKPEYEALQLPTARADRWHGHAPHNAKLIACQSLLHGMAINDSVYYMGESEWKKLGYTLKKDARPIYTFSVPLTVDQEKTELGLWIKKTTKNGRTKMKIASEGERSVKFYLLQKIYHLSDVEKTPGKKPRPTRQQEGEPPRHTAQKPAPLKAQKSGAAHAFAMSAKQLFAALKINAPAKKDPIYPYAYTHAIEEGKEHYMMTNGHALLLLTRDANKPCKAEALYSLDGNMPMDGKILPWRRVIGQSKHATPRPIDISAWQPLKHAGIGKGKEAKTLEGKIEAVEMDGAYYSPKTLQRIIRTWEALLPQGQRHKALYSPSVNLGAAKMEATAGEWKITYLFMPVIPNGLRHTQPIDKAMEQIEAYERSEKSKKSTLAPTI